MITVHAGLMNDPIPMHDKTPHCGVSDLFAGQQSLSGYFSISLFASIFFRRVRRG